MRHPTPQAAITYNLETGRYGLLVWFEGKQPHFVMADVFATPDEAREWLDPHGERVWENPGIQAGVGVVCVSKQFKEGTVPMRV